MEYPFKDLMPLDEVLEREGYYKDWTHLDPEVFYSLTQISNFIKTKGYGVDVRLLIAQLAEHFGLKTTQIVDLGNLLQAEHTSLKQQVQQAVAQVNADRNALETQFNQSVAQMEADKNAVIANATVDSEVILARGGKATLGQRLDETTAQLAQTDYEATRKRKLEDLEPEVLSAIEGGEGTSFNLLSKPQINSVTPSTLSFKTTGLNFFHGEYVFDRVVLSDGRYSDAYESRVTAIIPVLPNTEYFIEKDIGNLFRAAWHDSYPEIGDQMTLVSEYMNGSLQNPGKVNAPESAKFLVISVDTEGRAPRLQVTANQKHDFFIGYDFIAGENVQGFKHILNRTDIAFYNNKYFIDLIYDGDVFKGGKVHDGVRLLYGGKRRQITNEGVEVSVDSNPNGYYVWLAIDLKSFTLKTGLFDAVNNETGLKENDYLIGMVNPLKKEFFGFPNERVTINNEPVIPETTKEIINTEPKYYVVKTISDDYERPDDVMLMSDGVSEVSLLSTTHQDVYDIMDNLVTDFPESVERTLKANDEAGLPIYEYYIKSPYLKNDSEFTLRKPLIGIVGGLHGIEQGSSWQTVKFFDDLLRNPKNQQVLEFLRWNVDFKVIPVLNPSGYDNNIYENSNDIDIARDFNTFETIGAQVINQWLKDNPNFDWVIDHHNIYASFPMTYPTDERSASIMNSLILHLNRKWRKDYSVSENTLIGEIWGSIKNNMSGFINSQGIKALLLETPWMISFGGNKYDKTTLETGTETLGNLIIMLVKSLY